MVGTGGGPVADVLTLPLLESLPQVPLGEFLGGDGSHDRGHAVEPDQARAFVGHAGHVGGRIRVEPGTMAYNQSTVSMPGGWRRRRSR